VNEVEHPPPKYRLADLVLFWPVREHPDYAIEPALGIITRPPRCSADRDPWSDCDFGTGSHTWLYAVTDEDGLRWVLAQEQMLPVNQAVSQ
jgi:hypothetical protein